MKIRELKKYIEQLKDDDELLISCDEELNLLYSKGEIAKIGNKRFVIYGFSGSEVEQ
jgi:hypothetical protein|tara:strand:- start:216 stop:386 length:171 start_codon:yes stop_codon:yes gene_type:complete